MDIGIFNRAKEAYDAQSWDMAVILFSQCGTGPGTGEACHLCGNALMRLGRVQEAVQAYKAASNDTDYKNRGAVFTNLGKAQMLLGDYYGAVDSLRAALQDSSYPGAYKAQIALGDAYSRLGDPRSAGVAYRNAALDGNNPDPAKSLINLGVCFMQLKRPADAAEAYRTALDFAQNDDERNVLNANLGQAYVALNRMLEAVNSFNAAIAGGYELSPSAKSDFARAQAASDALALSAGGVSGDSTEMFLKSYGQGPASIDPLDPLGNSDAVMPSADKSGFFDIDEAALEAHAREQSLATRNESHIGKNILVVFLTLLIAAIAAAWVMYMRGYGLPTQQSAIDHVMSSAIAGTNSADGWNSNLSDTARADMLLRIEQGSTYSIEGLDQSARESKAIVKVTSPSGSDAIYSVELERGGVGLAGWVVSNVSRVQNTVTDETFNGVTSEPVGASDPVPEESSESEEEYIEGEEGFDEYYEEGYTEEGSY